MSDTEDYPGPTHHHPDKEGQDPRGRADEDMVKPTSRPEPETKEKKAPPAQPESRSKSARVRL